MIKTKCLNKNYSTTRLCYKLLDDKYLDENGKIKKDYKFKLNFEEFGIIDSKIPAKENEKFDTFLFLLEGEGRKGEGGLRTKGYFKFSYKKVGSEWYVVGSNSEKIKKIELPTINYPLQTTYYPLITIITVVYNGEKYLEETIQSVINQTYSNVEYIIIDGGSTDGTIDIIKKYEENIAYWVSEPDDGQTDALIKGFDRCTGDILYWLNYDDLLYDENTLIDVVKVFENNDNIELVYGDDLLVDKDLNIIKLRDFSFHSLGKLMYYKSISQPSSFFTRKVYKEFGLNKDLLCSMDLDLWLNIFSKYKTKYINQILSKNRIHDERKMIAFEKEAKIEAKELRYSHGANKILFDIFKYIYKVLEIKNYIVSKFYKALN